MALCHLEIRRTRLGIFLVAETGRASDIGLVIATTPRAISLSDTLSHLGGVMQTPITETPSSVSGLRRALGLWPYLFIAVSITGFAYMALNAAR